MAYVDKFLQDLGLSQYVDAFRSHEVDADLLPSLTSHDLTDIGVTVVGHRRKILNAAANLSANKPAPAAERRQLTVMFCDLVGSTALSETLDPEDMRDLIGLFHKTVSDRIERHGGYVASLLGDGVLACFGYPRAQEDDAEQAVRAGLEAIDAVGELRGPGGQQLQVRIGIATGLVVVGDLTGKSSERDQGVIGDTPNLAARLQAQAAPGTILVSASTRQLLGSGFNLAEEGAYQLKGFAGKTLAWKVLGESETHSRYGIRHGQERLQLVGREAEFQTLLDCWARSDDGVSQVALLSGEAGIGKSRLTEAFIDHISAIGGTVMRYYCSVHYQTTSLNPLILQLLHTARIGRTDNPVQKKAKLGQFLAEQKIDSPIERAVYARILDIPTDEEDPLAGLPPVALKDRMFSTVIRNLGAHAANGPVLVLIEDAHWIDPSTLELLTRAVSELAGARLMILVNHRPEFTLDGLDESRTTRIDLERLTTPLAERLIREVAGGLGLPADVMEQICGRTDGVPLYIEEMTRSVLESGYLSKEGGQYRSAGPIPPLAIPSTLHDSLMSRIDRLTIGKEIAQIGAVIGRTFTRTVLAFVAPLRDRDVEAGLNELVSAKIAERQDTVNGQVYSFRHALLRDAAYESLLRTRRIRIHAEVARAARDNFPEMMSRQPEILAHHFAEAHETVEAVRYLQLAGDNALRRGTGPEAVQHMTRALELLEPMGDEPDIQALKVGTLVKLGSAYLMLKGQGSDEVRETYGRAWELSRSAGSGGEDFSVLFGLWRYYLASADLSIAKEAGQRLLGLAQATGDPVMYLAAQMAMAVTQFQTGEFEASHACAKAGYETLQRNPGIKSSSTIFLIGQDPEVACLSSMAMCDCLLGRGREAIGNGKLAHQVAQEMGHPFNLAAVEIWMALIYLLRSDPTAAIPHAEKAMEIGETRGFPMWRYLGQAIYGGAIARYRDLGEGIALMRKTLAIFDEYGFSRFSPLVIGLLADAQRQDGNWKEAMILVDRALAAVNDHGEKWFKPELLRIRANVMADARRSPDEVREAFNLALDQARADHSRLAEFGIAIDYVGFQTRIGVREDIRAILYPACDWFAARGDEQITARAKEYLQ